jgi:hypothetical protein
LYTWNPISFTDVFFFPLYGISTPNHIIRYDRLRQVTKSSRLTIPYYMTRMRFSCRVESKCGKVSGSIFWPECRRGGGGLNQWEPPTWNPRPSRLLIGPTHVMDVHSRLWGLRPQRVEIHNRWASSMISAYRSIKWRRVD